MIAEYRFLRTRNGAARPPGTAEGGEETARTNAPTWFAHVTIVSAEASAWSSTRSDAVEELEPVYGHAIQRGLALAMAEQKRRNGPSFAITVTRLVETVVDTSADVVECAVAVAARPPGTAEGGEETARKDGATWKSFGNEGREVSLDFQDGRWMASFR